MKYEVSLLILMIVGPVLTLSWGLLGPSWGHIGAILGPSWAILGPSWSHLGSIWRSSRGQDWNLTSQNSRNGVRPVVPRRGLNPAALRRSCEVRAESSS